MSEQKLTGYPSIDKPWLKYYSEEAINAPLPEGSIYDYMAQGKRQHPDRIALDYFGHKISYGRFLDDIDRIADAFYAIGIREGDIVAGIAPCVPEIVCAFYALNKIGAVSDWFDPRTDAKTVQKELAAANAKVLLVLEPFANTFANAAKAAGVPHLIGISATASLPLLPKLVMSLKAKPKLPQGMLKWNDFLAKSSEVKALLPAGDAVKRLALMEHTGGTTGVPKAVMLTNGNANAVVHQYIHGSTPLFADDSWMTVAFPFTAYALICTHHIPLTVGMRCALCMELDLKKIEAKFIRGRHNHIANTPVSWEQMIHSEKLQKADLSFLKNPVVGADTLQPAKELEINAFLKQHGAKCEIVKGYGMTEVCAAVSVCAPPYNRLGSVGIPFLNTTISIFDPDTGNELSYDQQGEICISGPSVMLGYFNHPEETEKVLKLHKDGKLWMHSGDLGHMDADGFIFIDGRIKRMLIDHMGFKTFAPQVEQVLSQCDCIEKCCVVGRPDPNYDVGQIAVAYAVVKTDEERARAEMKQACKAALPEHSVPARYIILDALPYTPAGKVDFRALERMIGEEIDNDYE